MTSAPGKTYLLVLGILFIVFGSIDSIASLYGLITADYWDRILPMANGMSWSVYYTIILIGSVFRIIVGIMGIVYRTRLEKASLLTILGLINIVYAFLALVLYNLTIYGNMTGISTFSLIVSQIIPVLYVVGAHKNLTAYTEKHSTISDSCRTNPLLMTEIQGQNHNSEKASR